MAEDKKVNGKAGKKPNIFVRFGRWFSKLCKDVVGEMKKVVWTSKSELWKSTKIVLVTVVAFAVAIALVDVLFYNGIDWIARLVD